MPLYELVGGVVALLVMSQAVMWKIVPEGLLGKIWVFWVVSLDLFALVWFLYGESQSRSSSGVGDVWIRCLVGNPPTQVKLSWAWLDPVQFRSL